jgi:hypothetical protein
VLGEKAAECFAWSGAHDADAGFLHRYAGSPQRIAFMLTWHQDNPTTEAARARLQALTNP